MREQININILDVMRSPTFSLIVISLISTLYSRYCLTFCFIISEVCPQPSFLHHLSLSLSRSEEDDPSAALTRRNQTTAVILCGVIGALFDLEQEQGEGGKGGYEESNVLSVRRERPRLSVPVR